MSECVSTAVHIRSLHKNIQKRVSETTDLPTGPEDNIEEIGDTKKSGGKPPGGITKQPHCRNRQALSGAGYAGADSAIDPETQGHTTHSTGPKEPGGPGPAT
ncbi:hypothetical protein AMECASPLE_036740 [Ameca splendens]|uniref:Uncharacterized protein n=1 Tax=Ameca splendens TaxID=208324 RepID=A0ABV0XKS4_9TELE